MDELWEDELLGDIPEPILKLIDGCANLLVALAIASGISPSEWVEAFGDEERGKVYRQVTRALLKGGEENKLN